MSNSNTGGPAFPSPGVVLPSGLQQGAYEGMELRDYFAAKAMHGLIASRHTNYENGWYDEETVAISAYAMADAMLQARNK